MTAWGIFSSNKDDVCYGLFVISTTVGQSTSADRQIIVGLETFLKCEESEIMGTKANPETRDLESPNSEY